MVRPSYASVTATLALFISLGGGAYAAGAFPANSVGAKQIKKNAVERVKIKNNAIDGTKVLDNSLSGDDVNEAGLAKVPAATAADSATHANAAAALDRALYRGAGGSAAPGQTSGATATCDAGTRVVGGGVNVSDPTWAYVIDTYPDAGNTAWSAHVYTYSDSPGAVSFSVSAICAPIAAAG